MKLLTIAAVLLTVSVCGYSQIINPGFESFDQPVGDELFSRASGWTSYNFAAVKQSFTPRPERGQTPNWLIADNKIVANSGSRCLVLSTDDIGEDDNQQWWASASQQIQIVEGEKLKFSYLFGTFDYPSYSDVASVLLYSSETQMPQGPSPAKDIDYGVKNIHITGVREVGAYGSTDGWLEYEYIFTAEDAANYDTICFRVEDKVDRIYKSYLAVDDVVVTPEPMTVALLALGSVTLLRKKKHSSDSIV